MTAVAVLTFHLAMASESVDSLYRVFFTADKVQRTEVVNRLSQHLFDQEITDSLYHCTLSTGADVVEAMLHYLMAEHNYDQEQYEPAMEEGLKAQELIKKHKPDKLRSDVLGILSNAQFRLGDYDKALKTLLEAYQVDKALDNKELISSDLNSLAAIYVAVGQPEPGIHYIEKSIAMEREMGRLDRLSTRLGMASELYLLNNEPGKAMDAINEALELDTKNGREDKAAVRLIQKAAILESMSQLNEAYGIVKKALSVLEKANNTYSLAVAYNQMGAIEEKLGHHDAAVSHYKKALELSILCGSPKVERTAERGLWTTMRESNPSIALLHLERYTTLSDSLQKEMADLQMQVMEITAYNMEQIDLDKKSKRVSDLLKWGGFALVAMLTLMLGGLFASWRRGQKTLHIQQQTQEKQDLFFSNLTRKLHDPLTVVMGAGQQLVDNQKSSPEEQKRLGEMIVRYGKNMLGLVNQLIGGERVRLSIAQPDMSDGDIVMFVRLLTDNYTAIAHQQLINLRFSSPLSTLTVRFAPAFLRKIVHGLVSNAIKFTPRNGNITVTLTCPQNDRIRLAVSDTGIGIPVNARDKIFDPFSQSANGDDAVETSAELALINQLVQALNGTIKVESEVGQGTTFVIEFPVQIVEKPDAVALTHSVTEKRIKNTGKTKQKPLAFIVENNEDVAHFIASKLREDFDLRLAHDGQEGLNNVLELMPALIITNIRIPVIDGKELIRRLRANDALKHIPIIALTSNTSDHERISCLEAGADVVIIKPFISNELALHAHHLVNRMASMREQLLMTSVENHQSNDTSQMAKEDSDFLNRLVEVIHAQMAKEEIDMEHIAAAMSLSRKQLRTRVTAITGITPVAYILQVKLNYARRMMSSKTTSLTAIAAKCGFQNLSHFSKAFKQQFGVTPTQFRKNLDSFSPPILPQNP